VGRENGLSLYSGGVDWSFQGSVWLDGVSAENDLKNEDYGAGARVSRGHLVQPDQVLHLGLSYNQRRFAPVGLGAEQVHTSQRFRARPEIRLVNSRPFDVTLAEVTSTGTLGIEGAWVRGPFSLQAEYFSQRVSSEAGSSDFSGWYLAGSQLLTGESRPYRGSTGTFGAVSPSRPFSLNGGSGAWELSLRYSSLDLYDKRAPVVSASPGQTGEVWILGLNWYPTSNIRFMGNYVDARVDYPGEIRSDDRIRALQVRGQVVF
jgi:phosphate-selective porin OprO and OprP